MHLLAGNEHLAISAQQEIPGMTASTAPMEDIWKFMQMARDCKQPNRPDRNLRAASGGDGGSGGNGGSGGDGGDITIFYQDIAHLKQIHVVSEGGQGGNGGQGGRGGDACRCQLKNWSVRSCEQKKNDDGTSSEVCENHPKSCENGNHGQGGNGGDHGSDGRDGVLYIVKDSGDWVSEKLEDSIMLSQLSDTTFTLSEHFFTPKRGAVSLLANGSYMDDEYQEYEYTESATISWRWESPRSQSAFSNTALHMQKDGEQIKYSVENALIDTTSQGFENKIVTIKEIVLHDEAKNASLSINVDESSSRIVISDGSGYGDIMDTNFAMQYYTKTFFGWKKRLDRDLSEGEWVKEGDTYTIDLANLGMKKKYIKKGKRVKLDIAMERGLGEDTLIVELKERLKLE